MAHRFKVLAGAGLLGLCTIAGTVAALMGGTGSGTAPPINEASSPPNFNYNSDSDYKLPDDAALVKRSSFIVSVRATGDIIAKQQEEVRNELGLDAKILEMVVEGTKVEKGAVVATLSSEEVEKQIKEESSALETARAELTAAETGIDLQRSENDSTLRKADVTFELAKLEMRKWNEGEVVSRRQKLALELDEARTELLRTTEKLTQARSLKEKGFISADELQAAELAVRKADGALKTAQLSGEMFEKFELPKETRTKETAVADADAELDRTKKKNSSQLSQKEAELANRKRQLELRTTQMTRLTEIKEKAVLKAPVAGLVIYTSTINRWITDDNMPWRVGKTIHPGQPLIAIPELSSLQAKIKVPESISDKIKPGLTTSLKIDARAGQLLTGTVESIGGMAEQSWDDQGRSFAVLIKLSPEARTMDLRPSMRVEAEIQVDRVDDVLAVPVTSIFAEGPLRFVHRLRSKSGGVSGGLERVPLRIGRRSERFAEVLTGLNPGDLVLVRDLKPGELPPQKWSDQQLTAGGCRRGSDGSIILIAPEKVVEKKPDPSHTGVTSYSKQTHTEDGSADAQDPPSTTPATQASGSLAEVLPPVKTGD